MKNLVVGQEVLLFGVGFLDGKVVSVVPSIAVQTNEIGLLHFDESGKETEASRCLRLGLKPTFEDPFPLRSAGPEWQPWEVMP